jgi:hypothetical protein
MADETASRRNSIKTSLQKLNPGKKKKKKKAAVPEKLCFVITKNKSNSWADDLYACGRIADQTRVYH